MISMIEIEKIVEQQHNFFKENLKNDITSRITMLEKLLSAIEAHEEDISKALKADLNKSEFEAFESEIGIVLSELRYTIKHLPKWAKAKRVKTPLMHFLSTSHIYYEPYGVVLIMSPWNYPFLLSMIPLIGALGSGNCCILKPSQYSIETSRVMETIISEVFDPGYVTVVQGGREANSYLLREKFDYIFFTGSPAVGHLVMEAASKNLTPITLELGGKSPCIVDDSADIRMSARRIIWGKLLNAGQTCVAPDYILVQENSKELLIKELKNAICDFYGEKPLMADYYPKIINKKHFDRLLKLLKNEDIVFGGEFIPEKIIPGLHDFYNTDMYSKEYKQNPTYKIAPTIIDNVSWNSPIMNEEIFGPLIPILTFTNYDDLLDLLYKQEKKMGKPLALYLFTKDKDYEKKILDNVSFGGGCINDTIIHLANSTLPFGGVGASGMGCYHGKYSFETFSNKKSVVRKSTLFDIKLRYPPFDDHMKFLKKIIK